MPFKFSLLTDVSDVVRGMSKVDDALEQTADVLDDLGDDAQRSATKLEDGFEQAARGIDTDAEKIRHSVSDSTDKAADDGADSFKKLEK